MIETIDRKGNSRALVQASFSKKNNNSYIDLQVYEYTEIKSSEKRIM